MAEEHVATGDYVAHLKTYQSFTKLAFRGTVAIVILLILMAFFLL
jgi:Bacterial aa3 type cytochrome c oxidase subunit IV